jgi:hypothetical protein
MHMVNFWGRGGGGSQNVGGAGWVNLDGERGKIPKSSKRSILIAFVVQIISQKFGMGCLDFKVILHPTLGGARWG